MKNTVFTISLLAVIFCFASYFIFFGNEKENFPKVDKSQEEESSGAPYKLIEKPKLPSINDIQENETSSVNEHKLQEWLAERGYSPMVEINGEVHPQPSDYNSYNYETLKNLADAGDRHAQLAMSDKLMYNKNYELASKYAEMSIIQGFTKPITNIVSFHLANSQKSNSLGDKSSAKIHYIKAMAWFEVAKIRNDKYILGSKSIYTDNSSIRTTDEDERNIRQLGESIYQSLEKERINRGLGEFDNSLPTNN